MTNDIEIQLLKRARNAGMGVLFFFNDIDSFLNYDNINPSWHRIVQYEILLSITCPVL